MSKLIRYIKEYGVSFIVITLFILLLVFSSSSLQAAQKGTNLFLNNVLPSIFPFLIISNILINCNIYKVINKIFTPITKYLFKLPGISSLPIILGLISGYPIGAKVSNDLYEKNALSKKNANLLLGFTNNAGPLFIVSFIGISLYHDTKTGFLLLFVHFISAIISGVILCNFTKKNNIDSRNGLETSVTLPFSKILINSVKNSVNTILIIGGFIVFFSVIISLLQNSYFFYILSLPLKYIFDLLSIPNEVIIPTLIGTIEMTTGLNELVQLTTIPYLYKICFTSFLLGIGGISIYFQLLAITIDNNLKTKYYIIGKIIQAIISFILTYILIVYTPFFNLGDIETYTKPMLNFNTAFSIEQTNTFLNIIISAFILVVLYKLKQVLSLCKKNR